MKSEEVIHELSDTTNIGRMYLANVYFFKFFSLSIWLIIISIGLSFVAKSATAGTENINLYYRYVPYEGPKSTTGTTNQPQAPQQSSGANQTEIKKPAAGEQALGTAVTKQGEEAQKTSPGEATKKSGESAAQAPKEPSAAAGSGSQMPSSGQNAPQPPLAKDKKSECPMAGGQASQADKKIPPVKRPEKDTGEFPSGEFPSFCQVDVNGDHYVTKDELQNFPELLKVFDKVDAGKDGRLEQHEFQNLEMETTREGEVS